LLFQPWLCWSENGDLGVEEKLAKCTVGVVAFGVVAFGGVAFGVVAFGVVGVSRFGIETRGTGRPTCVGVFSVDFRRVEGGVRINGLGPGVLGATRL